jgi:radical SAM superfamily enzyme YgiQ (UPF0313 family)
MVEHGAVRKRCPECLRVALLYPSLYQAAVASLAYQNLYYMLNSMEGVYAERFVASKLAGEEPPPRSLETGTSLTKFDLVLVPVGYELDYITLARMLLSAGLSPLADNRQGPPVVVGGPVPTSNPELALAIADAVVVGDAEGVVDRLVARAAELGPWKALEAESCSRGILAKACSEPVERNLAEDLDSAFHSVMQFRIVGSGEPWGEAYMVEVSRGCQYMCRFCMEAHVSLPLRHRSYARVTDLVKKGVEVNGVSRVAFYALSFFDHPQADDLLEFAISSGLEAGVGSLRADTLTEERIELISQAGQRVLTVAPETFSPRLCRAILKCILEDDVARIAEWGWKRGMHLKLYLMVGLPGEKDSDVELAAEALKRLSMRAPPRREAIRVSLNPLVPKPMTPFQYLPLVDERTYLRRVSILRRVQSKVLAVDALSYRYAYAQAVLARGDIAVAKLVERWAAHGGRLGQLWRAARELGVDLEKYARGRVEPRWHIYVKPGFPRRALKRGLEDALARAGS